LLCAVRSKEAYAIREDAAKQLLLFVVDIHVCIKSAESHWNNGRCAIEIVRRPEAL